MSLDAEAKVVRQRLSVLELSEALECRSSNRGRLVVAVGVTDDV